MTAVPHLLTPPRRVPTVLAPFAVHRSTKQVAAAAGVSTAAVSQALNNKGRLSQETRDRILRAAAGLGWSPSVPATALRNARTRSLALVVRRPTVTVRPVAEGALHPLGGGAPVTEVPLEPYGVAVLELR